MTEKAPAISDAEREVLSALWDDGPGTVRAINKLLKSRGQDWSRSTVITLLQRLEKKGYVVSDKSGFAFVFCPALSREELMHEGVSKLAQELSAGHPVPLILAFAQRHRFTAQEIRQFREMIDQLKPKQPRRKSDK